MNASEWKAKARERFDVVELELPSGMVVKARRPGPIQLIYFRRLPLALAQKAIDAGVNVSPSDISLDDAVEARAFYLEMLTWCLVDPRMSLSPSGDDEIHPRDVPDDDWMFIIAWAMRSGEAAKLVPFRAEQGGGRAGGGGEVLELPTESAPQNQGSGFSAEF